MGIQSTQYITRERAIARIYTISNYILLKDYAGLEDAMGYEEGSIEAFINTTTRAECVENWTNDMLADKMDEPFYRFSMFDNYLIKGEDGHD